MRLLFPLSLAILHESAYFVATAISVENKGPVQKEAAEARFGRRGETLNDDAVGAGVPAQRNQLEPTSIPRVVEEDVARSSEVVVATKAIDRDLRDSAANKVSRPVRTEFEERSSSTTTFLHEIDEIGSVRGKIKKKRVLSTVDNGNSTKTWNPGDSDKNAAPDDSAPRPREKIEQGGGAEDVEPQQPLMRKERPGKLVSGLREVEGDFEVDDQELQDREQQGTVQQASSSRMQDRSTPGVGRAGAAGGTSGDHAVSEPEGNHAVPATDEIMEMQTGRDIEDLPTAPWQHLDDSDNSNLAEFGHRVRVSQASRIYECPADSKPTCTAEDCYSTHMNSHSGEKETGAYKRGPDDGVSCHGGEDAAQTQSAGDPYTLSSIETLLSECKGLCDDMRAEFGAHMCAGFAARHSSGQHYQCLIYHRPVQVQRGGTSGSKFLNAHLTLWCDPDDPNVCDPTTTTTTSTTTTSSTAAPGGSGKSSGVDNSTNNASNKETETASPGTSGDAAAAESGGLLTPMNMAIAAGVIVAGGAIYFNYFAV
ncbi:unnamed protein product [Amoebophrya sp. A120]|nr:unnamed protein product [Amoebophrya sp. A120]|eukprot:GSA120T00006174001.1